MEQDIKPVQEKRKEDRVIRLLATDIEGKMTLYSGLTKIKGISWGMANAICNSLKMNKNKKIGSLSEEELEKVSKFVKNPNLPDYLLNRAKNIESGEDQHLVGSDLELRKEFDIKKLKKIKSYRGIRHNSKLPLRGQRTRSNFRRNRAKGSGIKKKVKKQEGK